MPALQVFRSPQDEEPDPVEGASAFHAPATDRVICLNGHVCCSGTPTAVASSAEYKALFGARAASSLAVYEHHHDHTHLPDGRVRHADGTVTDHCHSEDGHHHDHDGHEHEPHGHNREAKRDA